MANTISLYILGGLLGVMVAAGVWVRIYMLRAGAEQKQRQDIRLRLEHIQSLNKEGRRLSRGEPENSPAGQLCRREHAIAAAVGKPASCPWPTTAGQQSKKGTKKIES
ncbi:hypothetical protein KRR38_34125 [Novosphingobium sp. G106]|uniref:hypothetical protein n=1 Tax=Novosphingobium sp. G106 TaxID=2849500 RepID=UPI001C2D01E1|nr:hypothetical protein [Novosphingobium sp. G106]MBV1692537.1 hypothetical protein [Novosphingobium sp. G106]